MHKSPLSVKALQCLVTLYNVFVSGNEKIEDGFHVTYCFGFYQRWSIFLEAKNGSRQWENLKNLLLKQITNLLK